MELKLLVIRTPTIETLSDFYQLLGLVFEYHKHNNSPYHYSATIGTTVLEIYPLAKDQAEADKQLRLWFSLDDFENTIELLKEKQIPFVTQPTQTEYGFMAIIRDPDGRKLELYKSH